MSTRSVADKLLIKPTTTLWSSHPPRLELVEPLPTGVRRVDAPEQARTALVFADDAASLRDLLAAHQERLARAEVLWVANPKGNRTDINRDSLWPILGEHEMRPVTQVSIDQVWSALRFRPLKQGETPFTRGVELARGRDAHLVEDPVAVVVDPGVGALALAEPVGRAARRDRAAAVVCTS
jgi:hypothetical protein